MHCLEKLENGISDKEGAVLVARHAWENAREAAILDIPVKICQQELPDETFLEDDISDFAELRCCVVP